MQTALSSAMVVEFIPPPPFLVVHGFALGELREPAPYAGSRSTRWRARTGTSRVICPVDLGQFPHARPRLRTVTGRARGTPGAPAADRSRPLRGTSFGDR